MAEFHSVVIITFASHAKGPWFEPVWNYIVIFMRETSGGYILVKNTIKVWRLNSFETAFGNCDSAHRRAHPP